MADPKISIGNLLSNNWDSANTSSITPTFSTGWYDHKAKRPQVTLSNPIENPISNGPVPFFGMVSTSPAQYLLCSLAINVWAVRTSGSINPKQCVYEVKEEIKRLLIANYAGIAGLDFVAWNGGHEVVETDQTPPVFRFIGEVAYGYLNTISGAAGSVASGEVGLGDLSDVLITSIADDDRLVYDEASGKWKNQQTTAIESDPSSGQHQVTDIRLSGDLEPIITYDDEAEE